MQKVSTQQGFTLIELIIVIVLLGILAVTAAPKFLNLQDDARDSVLEGIAGSLESASSIIYGKALVQDQAGATGTVELNSTTSVTTVFG
ncbi:MAG: prepilin-type N-terminal cleavage/methylation domain-containing protein, partial [Pseudomonadota bacterium]|nr:prepilin-type N-terminal cleavage/methylation domain-containing protein [Pseudomonadota bacterium]